MIAANESNANDPMTETSISFVHGEDFVTIYTTSAQTFRSIVDRLEKFNGSYEDSEYQNGDGSYKIKVPKEDIRSPKGIIKASR